MSTLKKKATIISGTEPCVCGHTMAMHSAQKGCTFFGCKCLAFKAAPKTLFRGLPKPAELAALRARYAAKDHGKLAANHMALVLACEALLQANSLKLPWEAEALRQLLDEVKK